MILLYTYIQGCELINYMIRIFIKWPLWKLINRWKTMGSHDRWLCYVWRRLLPGMSPLRKWRPRTPRAWTSRHPRRPRPPSPWNYAPARCETPASKTRILKGSPRRCTRRRIHLETGPKFSITWPGCGVIYDIRDYINTPR